MSPDPGSDSGVSDPAPPAIDPEEERSLALRAQGGDRDALDRLVRAHHQRITGLLWKFTRSRHDLSDLVQETFLRVLRALPAWRPNRPFGHWVSRVAVNVGRDYCRRRTVRLRWMVDVQAAAGADGSVAGPEPVEPTSDPAARSAANEAKELLARLPPDDQTLLTLFHLEGWDLRTIAKHLGWTHTATKLRAWRARQRLRSLLESPQKP